MIEILRTNNPVELSYCTAQLEASGIPFKVLDQYASMVEGSIGAIQQRVLVNEADEAAARRIVSDMEAR